MLPGDKNEESEYLMTNYYNIWKFTTKPADILFWEKFKLHFLWSRISVIEFRDCKNYIKDLHGEGSPNINCYIGSSAWSQDIL